jgi:hypothetical protein
MTNRRTLQAGLCCAAAAALAACGGGSNDASIGGTVSGLNAGQSVVLQDNNSDSLTITASGSFRFATALPSGSIYSVSVLTQPAGQICEVANGAGDVDAGGNAVSGVAVACVNTSSLGGTVSGLAAGTAVTLSNGSVLLPVAANGGFAFPGVLVAGTAFQVTVATPPLGQSCTVLNGVGTVTSSSQNLITVTCA